jgi:hypothetical protein
LAEVQLIHDNMALAYFFFDGKFEFIAQFDPISLFISVMFLE